MRILLIALLCWLVYLPPGAPRVLLGIEVHGATGGGEPAEHLLNSLKIAAATKAYIESSLHHQCDVFACFSSDVPSATVASTLIELTALGLPFYFSAAPANSACALEYPESELPDYSALMQLRVDALYSEVPLLSETQPADPLAFFALPVSSVLEANAIHRSVSQGGKKKGVGEGRALMARVLAEHSRGFDLVQYLRDHPSDRAPRRPSPEHTHFPMFTPAALAVKHESGICQLWWPLNGSEIIYYPSGVERVNPSTLIMACNFPEAPEEISYHFKVEVESGPPENPVNEVIQSTSSSRQRKGHYHPFSIDMVNHLAPGPVKVNITVTAGGKVITNHAVQSHCISIENYVPTAHSVSPILSSFVIREFLGMFLNALGLRGTYVEVGVHRGVFAAKFLVNWAGRRYVAVDPWEEDFVEDYIDGVNMEGKDRLGDMDAFLAAVDPYMDRVSILRAYSTVAAAHFVDGTIDAVFIDAVHHYHMVMQDMQAWWPKIKSGGIMLGHDYYLGVHSDAVFTVKPAVLEFGRRVNLPVFHTPTRDSCWYIMKP